MNIEEKKILIDKLVQDRDNILLDYVSFSQQERLGISEIAKKWKEGKKLDELIPIKFYLHIPFCSRICTYCMYNTIVLDKKEEFDKYISDVFNYISRFKDIFLETRFRGIYVGGGTPSLFNVERLHRLFSKIFQEFSFDEKYYKTIELNPSSTTFEKLKCLKELGFDRVSFGVQSFNKKTLEKENRTYVSPERMKNLIDYSKELGFLDINTDIIVGMNDEGEDEVFQNFKILQNISPYTITVYTILKDMERSYFYKEDKETFYRQIGELYSKTLRKSNILSMYKKDDWSNVLGFTLTLKGKPKNKLLYDAHCEEKESLFGVGYKAYSKIWGIGSYEIRNFGERRNIHAFQKLTTKLEMYSYVLQTFQYKIDKKHFSKNFHLSFDKEFSEVLSFLEGEKIIKNSINEVVYIGDEKKIGYYGMLFLDTKTLLLFIKYRFYTSKN